MENGTTENKGTFLDLFSGIGGFRLGMEQAVRHLLYRSGTSVIIA